MFNESLRDRCAIAVMAKAPKPGKVKTRLCPPLLPEEASSLSAAFLRDITENIRQAASTVPIDGWIAYAPAGDERAFEGIIADGTSLTLADGQMDMPDTVTGFGRCLFHTFIDLLAHGYGAVVVLNSDSPTLPTARLSEAAASLLKAGDRAVMGAAEDGGYYLLGLKQLCPEPFCGVAWSSEIVAEQTRQRIESLGLDLVELESWYDVDDELALHRLMRDLSSPSDAFRAPATAACMERLQLFGRLAG